MTIELMKQAINAAHEFQCNRVIKILSQAIAEAEKQEQGEPDYKAFWEQMCQRCDELDAKLGSYLTKETTKSELNEMYCQGRDDGFEAGRLKSIKQEPVEIPPVQFEKVADGIEIGYDFLGGVDIRLGGEFVYVHINYDYRYTHNAARKALAEQIVGLFTHPQPNQPLTDESKDAHRYRLLRRGQQWSVINGIGDVLRADALDAAIDAVAQHRGEHA